MTALRLAHRAAAARERLAAPHSCPLTHTDAMRMVALEACARELTAAETAELEELRARCGSFTSPGEGACRVAGMDREHDGPDLRAPEASTAHHRHHGPTLAQELARIHARLDRQGVVLTHIARTVRTIATREGIIMADLTQLDAAVDQLVAADAAAAGELQTLADEVRSLQAGTITQAQIESIQQKVTDAATAIAQATASAESETATPAAPADGGGAPPA